MLYTCLVRTRFISAFLIAFTLLSSSQLSAQTKPQATASFATLSAKADAARDADRLDEATALYKKALALHPRWAEGWWSLGTIAYDGNSYAQAARAFQRVTQLSPANGNALVMLGLSEFELGRDAPSLQHIEKGISLGLDKDPNLRHVVLYHQGVLLQRAGKFQAARDILEQLSLQGVQSDDLANTLGMVLLRMRNRTPPPAGTTDATVVTGVGRAGCLTGKKQYDESRKELSAVVDRYPKYPNIHYAFGLLLTEGSDPTAGAAEFKKEIENNPSDIVSRLQIAAALYKTDSAAGVPYAEEALKLAPHQAFGHYLLGMLLLDTDNYERAIGELEAAQKAYPSETKIYLALGTAYSRAGRKQDATRARATYQRLTAAAGESKAAEDISGTNGPGDARVPAGDLRAPQ